MPVPKSWIIFFLIVVAIIAAILVTQPEEGVQTVSVSETTIIDDTRGTTFSTMLDKGGNAIYVEDQLSGIAFVRVGFVVLAAPGFVVVFNDNEGVPGEPIGHSEWLSTGGEHLIVPLAQSLVDDQVYYAMLYLDDGDGVFDSTNDTQATDSEDSVILMSFLASEDAVPESEAVSP